MEFTKTLGWLSKLGSVFGYLKNRCRIIMGYPKRGHNFDNYPLKEPENPPKNGAFL